MAALANRMVWILIIFPLALWGAELSYSVEFEGIEETRILKELRSSSQLLALRKKPPPSLNALRFRAESDTSELLKILQAYGYLEAKIEIRIEENRRDFSVIVAIDPGPVYWIDQYLIQFEGASPRDSQPFEGESLGIKRGAPLETKQLLDTELCALQLLSERGFPLATVKEREIIADGASKKVKVIVVIDTGPFACFGATAIEGNKSVCPSLIEQQIRWCENDPYDSCLVEETQKGLIDTGLFCSVYITHPKNLDGTCHLPMKIEVSEAKHKSVSLGASYQTSFGPGVTFGWENRNVGGLGRRVCLQLDIAQRSHSGIASYLIPNFYKMGQNYIIQAQATQESITPYHMQSYTFLNRFDWQWGKYLCFSAGPKVEYLIVTNSVDNGDFLLVEAPFFLRWTNVTDFLNPLSGVRFEYRAVPAVNIKDFSDFYASQVFSLSVYLPLWGEEFFILAQKWTLGTIVSNGIGAIPVPKRFFGGSEDNLRGYKYYTVSPLNEKGKPIGGRSEFFYTIEPRFRISKSFGLVPFFDIGNVYSEQFPTFKGKWRKSTGIGFRYYSFLGPLRLDVAFPLNRRDFDPHWWVFVSLGQTF